MNHLFIVGAQRAGTTYLYHLLQDHPHITMAQPVRPEPKYFLQDENFTRGRTYYEKTLFPNTTKDTRYFGEKSTSYIEKIKVAERIHEFYPTARILIILRNPVLRAYSNYLFSVKHGLEKQSFRDAIELESSRIHETNFTTSVNPFAYRTRGFYIQYINNYLKVFKAEQIKIIIFEEIVANLLEVQNLYHWLGVNDSFVPESLSNTFNASLDTDDKLPTDIFRILAKDYQQTLQELESHLDRKIMCWRTHWENL